MKPEVFVSSTFYDQKHVRNELCNFVKESGYEAILSENGDIGYTPGKPLDESCYTAMRKCHMAIVLIGGSYGSAATGEDSSNVFNVYISITRKEFREAINSNKPVYVFIDKAVLAEYNIYRNNVEAIENKIMNINFNATNNINVFRFIREIYDLVKIPVFGFETCDDIKTILKKQWADMVASLLLQVSSNDQDIDDNIDELSIAGEWVSIFVEGTKLLNENILVEQKGRTIKATFKLDSREYIFNGKFKNRILTGEYTSSKNARKDERGNMMLKLIGDSLLSGQITFVYNNEEVNTSPYVWALKSSHDLAKGTYNFCESCVIHNRKCCCANEDVDMPVLLPFEVEQISRKYKISQQEFAISKSQNLAQMKRIKIDDLNGCFFFDGSKCKIYNDRPIDCRLFPFDVVFNNGEYQLIYYTTICPTLNFDENVEKYAHNVKPLLSLMYPFLSESTFTEFNQKLKLHNYKVVNPLTKIL